jgi:hypothetical protein
LYEWNHCFQNSWTTKLPWANFVVGVKTHENVMQIKCKVCSVNKGQDNLMAPKLDSLWKHDHWTKVTTTFMGVEARDF